MNEVIQNCRSSKNGVDFDPGKTLATTWGIKSPIMIKYDTATPDINFSTEKMDGGIYTETFYCNCAVKHDSCIWIRSLCNSKERRMTPFNPHRTPRQKI